MHTLFMVFKLVCFWLFYWFQEGLTLYYIASIFIIAVILLTLSIFSIHHSNFEILFWSVFHISTSVHSDFWTKDFKANAFPSELIYLYKNCLFNKESIQLSCFYTVFKVRYHFILRMVWVLNWNFEYEASLVYCFDIRTFHFILLNLKLSIAKLLQSVA